MFNHTRSESGPLDTGLWGARSLSGPDGPHPNAESKPEAIA